MSDIDTREWTLEENVFGDDVVDSISVAEPETKPVVRLARRLAVALFALSVGSLVFGSVFAPLIHDRQSEMLEDRLAYDLINGLAPVSNPIAVGAPVGLIDIPERDIRTVVIEGTRARELSKAAGHLSVPRCLDSRVCRPFSAEVVITAPNSRTWIRWRWATRSPPPPGRAFTPTR
jgi:hypothetical protein